MNVYLDFEKPISDLDLKVSELKVLMRDNPSLSLSRDIERLERKLLAHLRKLYSKLDAWQKVQVARHVDRPQTGDYIRNLFTDYVPLAGDRLFGEDAAIIGGLARLDGHPVLVLGHERGRDITERMRHNFGMAHPEGYRKAVRLMRLAEKFSIPVVTMINTPGAYPGKGAEERGQAQSIAASMRCQLVLEVPVVSVLIGEGGSGGAIALGCANRVLMLEHSVYSVISPEGAASILWRSSEKAKEAASSLKLTAQDLYGFGVVDEVIEEPVGGGHREPSTLIQAVGASIRANLSALSGLSSEELVRQRQEKFLNLDGGALA